MTRTETMLCSKHCVLVAIALHVSFLATATLGESGAEFLERKLSYSQIVLYEPGSDVTQHSYIDLDQQEMEAHLGQNPPDYTKAKNIYTLGGNSGGYAQLTVAALAENVAKGAAVMQVGNAAATGSVKSAASAGATQLEVSYTSMCKMGGSSSQDTIGCFNTTGAFMVGRINIGTPAALTNKYRTLAGFSTAAQAKMGGQQFYMVYRAYYNDGDYAHQFVTAALDGTGVFAGKDAASRVEYAKKGSAYMNVWMYVIREMEDAIMDCKNDCINCNDDPVHAWDEAVAFYAGSLEGSTGNSAGKLLYRLAEKRCGDFGTCTGFSGISAVNAQMVLQFKLGQTALLRGRCVDAVPIKQRVVELMSVALIQGALRYAYKVDQLQGGSKEKAEGAAFSAAILPRVAACDRSAAVLVSDNMKIDSASPMGSGFEAVKKAFESTYACMGITCKDVGGLTVSGSQYFTMAEPCADASLTPGILTTTITETDVSIWLIISLVAVVVVLVLVCIAFIIFKRQANEYKRMAESRSNNGVLPDKVGQK